MRLLPFILAVLGLGSPAQANWRVASTDHFSIYSEDNEEALRQFAARLERFDDAMRAVHGLPDLDLGPSNRLTIYVVDNASAVRRLADMGSGVLGFYLPRAGNSVAFIPRRIHSDYKSWDEETVLLHEYAHHFLHQNQMAAYPAWFIEGSAEFYSTARFNEDGSVTVGAPAEHRAWTLFAWGDPLTVEDLLTKLPSEMGAREWESLYGRGWLLTHYLLLEPKRQGQLTQYLVALNSGQSSLEAAEAAFGDPDELWRELEGYKKRRTLAALTVRADRIDIGRIAVRALSPGEEAMMGVRIQSRRGVDKEEAKALVPDARRAAAVHPGDAVVQTWMAEIEYDAGNFAAAEAAANRALALDPKAIDALLYKARAQMAVATNHKATDAQVWQEARRWIASANRIDPDNPEPLILFYDSFGLQGVEPTPNAVTGLNYAYALAPYDRGLRMKAANRFLLDGKGQEARTALAPLAFDPHGGEAGKTAAEVIRNIDAGDITTALSVWREAGDKEKEEASDKGA